VHASREVPERFTDDEDIKAAYLAIPTEVLPHPDSKAKGRANYTVKDRPSVL
jgi:hypothetical protein